MGVREREESQITPRFLGWMTGKMMVPSVGGGLGESC